LRLRLRLELPRAKPFCSSKIPLPFLCSPVYNCAPAQAFLVSFILFKGLNRAKKSHSFLFLFIEHLLVLGVNRDSPESTRDGSHHGFLPECFGY
jgi:hypothetical protein